MHTKENWFLFSASRCTCTVFSQGHVTDRQTDGRTAALFIVLLRAKAPLPLPDDTNASTTSMVLLLAHHSQTHGADCIRYIREEMARDVGDGLRSRDMQEAMLQSARVVVVVDA